MTGLCPTCAHATEVQHIGRTRIPVEFCPHCNVTHGPLNAGQTQVLRQRDGGHRDGLAGDEYTREALAIARDALPQRIPPGNRQTVAHSKTVTE